MYDNPKLKFHVTTMKSMWTMAEGSGEGVGAERVLKSLS